MILYRAQSSAPTEVADAATCKHCQHDIATHRLMHCGMPTQRFYVCNDGQSNDLFTLEGEQIAMSNLPR